MQTTEQIIETGWHQFSIPPYPHGTTPRLVCWCGMSFPLMGTSSRFRATPGLERFLREHAECAPNEQWLMHMQRSTQ